MTDLAEWVKATQGFVILSMICSGWQLFFCVLYIFQRHFEEDKRLIFFNVIFSFATSSSDVITDVNKTKC